MFWLTPILAEVGPADEGELIAVLDAQLRATLVTEVARVEDLLLTPRGRTAEGLAYTRPGLKQVLSVAGPGAFELVTDLATGASGGGGEPGSDEDAIRAFNQAVRARADRFVGRVHLVKNVALKTIDGTLGPGYILYENSVCLERAREVAGDQSKFLSGHLHGRALVVRYVRDAPLAMAGRNPPQGPTFAGTHLSNAEAGGDAAMRVAPFLALAGGAALGADLGGRIVHRGRQFSNRIARAYARAADHEYEVAPLQSKFEALARQPLPASFETDDMARQAMASALRGRGLTKAVALHAVDVAAARRTRGARSALDVFLALVATGAGLPTWAREPAERAAHDLLFGRYRLGGNVQAR